ncbi:MAG TPA: tetratricopeptide repeat protein [Candidatus Angelobacter sp.]|nr:tetratricopeptide repeat protein [Candidatus Angelobacter sp.]
MKNGKGAGIAGLFRPSRAEVSIVPIDVPTESEVALEEGAAAVIAGQLEARIGNDRIETQIHLSDLIRVWEQAGRPDKVLYYRWFGLDVYNTLGLYADALRYAEGLLEFAFTHAPDDKYMQWSITVKVLNAHIGLQDVEATLKLAEGAAMKLADPVPAWRSYLFYMLAMMYARYRKPRDLAKGEDYLDRGLAALEEANLPEEDIHFHSVFNRNGLAMVRNFQGRHHDAIDLCRSGLARLNTHLAADKHRLHRSVLVYNIGQVYLAVGSHDEALEHYAAAIAMDPNYSEYYNERGSIFLQLGRLKEALTDYLKAIELSPPYFEVFTNIGQCYRQMGAMPEAIEAYSRAIDLEPNHVLALLGRAKACEDLSRAEAAIADYTVALSCDGSLWEAFASRGVMYYESGNLHASLADLSRAIEIKPDRGELYENRAIVLSDLNQRHNAARDLEMAIGLASTESDKLALESRLYALEHAESDGKATAF